MRPCPFRATSRSLSCLTALSAGVSTSLRFPVPSTASPGLAPSEASCSVSPRFRSRVFSTPQRFPSTPEFRGLVSCRIPVPGIPSLEPSPRKNRAPLSRPPAPLPLSTNVPNRTARLPYHRWFHRPPRFRRSSLDPSSDYGRPFHAPKHAFRLSWAPRSGTGSFRQLHRLRSFDPLTSPFTTSPSCPVLAADALLSFSSLQSSPSTARVLAPSQALRPERSPSARRP